MKIDISKLDKVEILIALYNNAQLVENEKAASFKSMTFSQAKTLLNIQKSFKDIRNVSLNIDLTSNQFNTELYDKGYGKGSAEKAINTVKSFCKYSKTKFPPLHEAVRAGDLDAIKYFLERGVDVESKDEDSDAPLHWAAVEGHTQVVEYLISHGANVNVQGLQKMTPLHWAAKQGHTQAVECLIDHGANIDSTDLKGLTPLHLAYQPFRSKTVAYLLLKGANSAKRDFLGNTPEFYLKQDLKVKNGKNANEDNADNRKLNVVTKLKNKYEARKKTASITDKHSSELKLLELELEDTIDSNAQENITLSTCSIQISDTSNQLGTLNLGAEDLESYFSDFS